MAQAQTNAGLERLIRLFRNGHAYLLMAEQGRLVLYEESDGKRSELARLTAPPAELAPFFEQLRAAIAVDPREKLPSDPGPLEPFQPPPEER